MTMSILEARSLYHRYSGKEVLKGVDFRIEKGETVALIGPTGAGKTTLLRLLGLIELPTKGKVFFKGVDVTTSGRERLLARRRMGFVFQKPIMFNASVYDNVAQGLRWQGRGGKVIRERVMEALEMVQLLGLERRNARTLSGGEAQRVALARALVLEPEVLLLDEPTANLDPVSSSLIESLISSFPKNHGTAMVLATHDMAQGHRLADRMVVLFEGRIVQEGKPGDVLSFPESEEVARLVGMENLFQGVIKSNSGGLVTIDLNGHLLEGIAEYPEGKEVYLGLRPEDVTVSLVRPAASSIRNCLEGKVKEVIMMGPLARVVLDCGFPLVALLTARSAHEMELGPGKRVFASFKATAIHIMPR